jgi:flagellar M-ring protein FliF
MTLTDLGAMGGRLAGWWREANATQRALLAGGALCAVLSVVAVVSWTSRPDFVVLFSGIDPEAAGQILDELDEAKVPHEVSRQGTTILVPADQVGELRLRIASKGLTGRSAIGYEIFDKSNLGMTEFLQQVNYRRALEGELTRTIAALDEVRGARVHLAIPERTPFRRDQAAPKASVTLDLRPGAQLRADQVRGIVALVSASVENMTASGVTLVDSTGRELGGGGSGELAVTSEQLRVQKEVEEHLQQKAMRLLEQVAGAGQTMVQVNADLDFERVERSVESYDPASAAIRSEQRTTGEGVGGDSQENILTNYEIDKTVENILKSVGSVRRLSVAVLVNGVVTEQPDGAAVYSERPQEELNTLSAMVKDAVGFSGDRGDSFEIASMRFARNPDAEIAGAPLPWWLLFPSMGSLLRGVIILMAVFLVAWGLRQSSTILVQAVEADRRRREKVLAVQAPESEAEIRREVIREQMNNLAQDRPAEVAQVLRSWLVEEKQS